MCRDYVLSPSEQARAVLRYPPLWIIRTRRSNSSPEVLLRKGECAKCDVSTVGIPLLSAIPGAFYRNFTEGAKSLSRGLESARVLNIMVKTRRPRFPQKLRIIPGRFSGKTLGLRAALRGAQEC